MQLLKIVNQQEAGYGLNIQLSEHEIFLNGLRSGDPEAFKTIYKQYAAAIYGMIRSKIADEHAAEIILEKIFLDFWNSISGYDETKFKIFTWLHQITNRQINLHQL